jgi:protein phosphatase 2C
MESLSHDAVSVIDRREMEDVVVVAMMFLTSTAPADISGGTDNNSDFFVVYDGHGGARVRIRTEKQIIW